MSLEAMAWVFRNSPYSGDRMVIHLAIADYANDDHGYQFWAAVPTLAIKSKCSERTVQYALKEMTNTGYLEVVEKSKGGARDATNTYRLLMPQSGRGANDAPVQTATPRGANDDIAPIVNRSKLKEDDELIIQDFEWLWKRYPKKSGKSVARRRYITLRRKEKASHDDIVEGCRRYVRRCRAEGREIQYMKGLDVVLGPQHTWRDELERDDPIEQEPKGNYVPSYATGQAAR